VRLTGGCEEQAHDRQAGRTSRNLAAAPRQGEYLEVHTLKYREAQLAALDADLVVLSAQPLNCETPLPALTDGLVVPNARFYVVTTSASPMSTRPAGG
jgi:hypothetical protein